ncbi:MAG TPA: zf-HC2 domain-containing protein, partial [Ktedonobacterales bacterium]
MSATTTHAWLRRVSDYHSGSVSATERAAVEAHLTECAECRLALAAYRRLYTLARSPLRLGDGGAGALTEYRPMMLEETMTTTDTDTRRAPPWRRPPTRLTALGAIAAVLVIAILAAALFARFRSPTQPVTPRPTPTATVAPLTWRQATLPSGYALPGPSGHDNGFAISPADGTTAWACAPIAASPGSFTFWATHDTAATWQQVSTLTPHAPATPQRCLLLADQYDPHTLVAVLSWGPMQTSPSPQSVSYLSPDGG